MDDGNRTIHGLGVVMDVCTGFGCYTFCCTCHTLDIPSYAEEARRGSIVMTNHE